MVSKNTVLISVNKNTKENLIKLKLHPSLSYNDVIVGLITSYRTKQKSEISEESSIEITEETTLDEVAEQNQIIGILQNHCGEKGDNEGAVETLRRIIKERDTAFIPSSLPTMLSPNTTSTGN